MPDYRKGTLDGFNIGSDGWEKSSGGNTCKATRKKDGATVFLKQYV